MCKPRRERTSSTCSPRGSRAVSATSPCSCRRTGWCLPSYPKPCPGSERWSLRGNRSCRRTHAAVPPVLRSVSHQVPGRSSGAVRNTVRCIPRCWQLQEAGQRRTGYCSGWSVQNTTLELVARTDFFPGRTLKLLRDPLFPNTIPILALGGLVARTGWKKPLGLNTELELDDPESKGLGTDLGLVGSGLGFGCSLFGGSCRNRRRRRCMRSRLDPCRGRLLKLLGTSSYTIFVKTQKYRRYRVSKLFVTFEF